MGETPKNSSNKCFICSSIPISKNRVYIHVFGRTSTDLAGIAGKCFQQLTKYERAAKNLQEIKQKLLSAFRNREQLRERIA